MGLSISVGLELPLGGVGVQNKVQRKTRVKWYLRKIMGIFSFETEEQSSQ